MSEMITSEDAQYAFEIVKAICAKVGPGLPGSPKERQRAGMIQRELEGHLGATNVVVEEFTLAPDAFVGSLPISGLFMLIAALLYISTGRFPGIPSWATATAALGFCILAVILILLEFILSMEFIDPFFKKKQSVNVIGTLRKPGTKDVKRLLILGGHHDSAWENNWFGFLGNVKRRLISKGHPDTARENTWLLILGYGSFIAAGFWLLGYVTLFVLSLLQLTGVIIDNPDTFRISQLEWILLIIPILPSVLFAMFSIHAGKNGETVPGAVDNLSASALTVAMCSFLAKNQDCIPPDTEIRFVSFGSEEAGLRGSRRYVARHLDELKRLDARLLNYEMVADREMILLTSDVNGSVKNSPEVVKSMVAAAKRAGVPYQEKPAGLGVGTDAAPFTRAGIKAMTLMPFKSPQQLLDFYHQKWDTPDGLAVEPLLNVLKLTLEWIRCGGE